MELVPRLDRFSRCSLEWWLGRMPVWHAEYLRSGRRGIQRNVKNLHALAREYVERVTLDAIGVSSSVWLAVPNMFSSGHVKPLLRGRATVLTRFQISPTFVLYVAHPVSIVLLTRSQAQLCESLVHKSASFRTLRTRLDYERESVSAPVFFLKY